MPDKATGRVVALIVLLILVAAALRGYLPNSERAPRHQSGGNPASLVFIAALLGVSLVIIVVALITRLREPRHVAPTAAGLSETLGGTVGRPSWRVLLLGVTVIVTWLGMVFVLTRFLQLGNGGQVTFAPETTAVPTNTTAPPAGPPSHPPGTARDVLAYLAAGTVTLLVLLVTATLVASRRRRPIVATAATSDEDDQAPDPEVVSESLARAAERGLAEIEDPNREPREAIIACYAAMEQELARIPGAAPQEFDTATEVLARAVEIRALRADNATQLVNLFAEARFSPHVMNEQHREVAVRVLQLVLAELIPHVGANPGGGA